MKHLSTSLKAIVIASMACAAGIASAATATQSLTVAASVAAKCKFFSSAQTLTFGALDPSNAIDTAGTGALVQYKCTKGTTPTSVGVGVGLNLANSMKDTVSGDLIPYTLTASATTAGAGFGSGKELDVTLTGNVLGTDYVNKSAGSYSDTVVLTLNY